ncbi:MAG: hypothetical protein ACXWP6_05475, partial [Ktedonobacterales bacterium]
MSIRTLGREAQAPAQVGQHNQRGGSMGQTTASGAMWIRHLRDDARGWLLARTFLPAWSTGNGYR